MKILFLIVINLVILVPLACGVFLMVRDTVRGRGKWGVNVRAVKCPDCRRRLRVAAPRLPATRDQALWGGWNCDLCGRQIDKWGNPLNPWRLR